MRRNRLFLNGLIASALLAALAFGARQATAKHQGTIDEFKMSSLMANMKVQAIKPVPLPAFTLSDTSGKEFAIQDQVGKVMLINFWTTS